MKLTRRTALTLSAAAAAGSLAGLRPAFAAEGDSYDINKLMAPADWADRWLGDENAPVTIIEYASTTCPHCATFHSLTYPQLKEQYVETGKVRFTLRPFVLNVLDAAVFMLAGSVEGDAYYDVLDTYFANQSTWATSQSPREAIEGYALELGFSKESFEAALTNQELFAAMQAVRQQALDEFGMTGTPSFYVNGTMLSGAKSIEQMSEQIDPLLDS